MASERRSASDRPRVLLSLENISSDPNIAVWMMLGKESQRKREKKRKKTTTAINKINHSEKLFI